MKNVFRTLFGKLGFVAIAVLVTGNQVTWAQDELVNVYSARKEALILPILERFTKDTGIAFNLITGKADELLKRITLEGDATPADVFITVDAGRLQRAKNAEVLQPIGSALINETVPVHLRDRDDYWVGLSLRARTIFYSVDRVDPTELSTYEQLVDPNWKNRICIRSSSNIYNQSLVASMIKSIGRVDTQNWAAGMVENFARPPAGGDTDQIKAVAAGECDIAIANTYYYARLMSSDNADNRNIAKKVGLFWPNQTAEDRGVHVNVSGGGIVKHAKHADNARRLLEYLVLPESQTWYAEVNNEYPVIGEDVVISEVLQNLGEFRADSINLTALGENNTAAVEVMDIAGWR